MDDYSKIKKDADKVIAENSTSWKDSHKEIKDAMKKAQQIHEYLKKALETHVSNAKMAQAEYGGWSKMADEIIAKQKELAEAKKAKDKAAVADLEKELKKLEKPAKSYQANITKGVETANEHMSGVREKIAAVNAIAL